MAEAEVIIVEGAVASVTPEPARERMASVLTTASFAVRSELSTCRLKQAYSLKRQQQGLVLYQNVVKATYFSY